MKQSAMVSSKEIENGTIYQWFDTVIGCWVISTSQDEAIFATMSGYYVVAANVKWDKVVATMVRY